MKLSTPISKDKVRFVCVSDTHCCLGKVLNKIPPGDVLLHAGDFSNRGRVIEVETFNEDLGKLPHTFKVVIAGNHEMTFDSKTVTSSPLREEHRKRGIRHMYQLITNAIYLQDSDSIALWHQDIRFSLVSCRDFI
jgi:predicted phosphohydrolase